MHLRYGLLADSVAPGPQGKKNIIGTFSTVHSTVFPAHHPSLSVAFRIEGTHQELGEHHLEVLFVDADFKTVGTLVQGPFDLSKEQVPIDGIPAAVEAALTLQGLLIPKPGPYEFVIRVDQRHLGSIPLYAVLHQPSS